MRLNSAQPMLYTKSKDFMKNTIENLDMSMNVRTFAVLQFYIHIWLGDFLCPIVDYCLRYKQRFLRTYSPLSQYGTVASWRNSLLSLFINY